MMALENNGAALEAAQPEIQVHHDGPGRAAGNGNRGTDSSEEADGFEEGADSDDGIFGVDEGPAYPALVQDELEHPTEPGHPDLGRDTGRSSTKRVTLNFINAVAGSGVLAIPFALERAGLVLGLCMICFVGYTTKYTVCMLVRTGLREGVRNYEELMDVLFGFPGWALVTWLLFLYDFGAMLSYLIILGDTSQSVMLEVCRDVFGVSGGLLDDYWAFRRVCILSVSLLLVLPFCLMRDISRLEWISSVSVVTIVLVILVVIVATATGDNCPDRESDPGSCPRADEPWLTVVGENPSAAFGILAFSLVCHDTAFLFFNSLRKPTARRWNRVVRLSLAGAIAVCLLLAVPSYISFRSTVKQNILANFAPDDFKIVVVRVFFLFTMAFTYPICFFICRHILNELIYRWEHRRQARTPGTPAGLSIKEVPPRRHLMLTLTIFSASVAIVCFVDELGLVMAATGNVCAVSIAFVLPPLCEMKSRWIRNKACRCAATAEASASQPLLPAPAPAPPSQSPSRSPIRARPRSCEQCYAAQSGWDAAFIKLGAIFLFGAFTMCFATMQTLFPSTSSSPSTFL